ncbi:MAG: 50S ribosomal protein L24 [Bacteroidetes bacterium]|jgi:large subunit ribosomal protein L24|nr:50S ribosomal protein L24 [Bacteroidota bacterium]MBT6684847.1 50S ribosomal protein L24 [Bacteroidota bacterium]MBT7142541.1 50S ribosomal protein L24 [Bacteroidota bacterium]MBT7493238.1 50S ribosomal protein L24 [Bacteroidota bacterium]
MRKKLHIKKGDTVIVISGEAKGQKGKVLEVIAKTNKAIVEQVNLVSRHTKPNAESPNGGIIKKEAPIHVSNILLVDPSTGEPTRIGRRISPKTNKLVRYAKKSGEEIK